MSYLGCNKDVLIKLVINNGLPGIDKIVTMGKTTEFTLIWDGYDLINSLSRIVYRCRK
jgi:hypothetical protein